MRKLILKRKNTEYEVLLDDSVYKEISRFSWRLLKRNRGRGYYVQRSTLKNESKTRRSVYLHRELMGLKKGDKREVDHKNLNSLDNRLSNLRICSGSQNKANVPVRSNNKTGLKGVSVDPRKINKKYRARIKGIELGWFDKAKDAAAAYNKEAIKIYGDFALLNKGV